MNISEKILEFTCKHNEAGQRLDLFLSGIKQLQDIGLSRSQIKSLVENEKIFVSGKLVKKAGLILDEGDVIKITSLTGSQHKLSQEAKLTYDYQLDIIYEDSQLIVVNKPSGLTVHPGANTKGQTLLNALLSHYKKSSQKLPEVFADSFTARGGIVHRLDKDTTGLMVCAKSLKAHQSLSRQFADRSIDRIYNALVFSTPRANRIINKQDRGDIDLSIGRDSKRRIAMGIGGVAERQAKTLWKVLERYPYATLVELKLMTGRTHQIRVHMNAIGSPVIGDKTYGEFSGLPVKLQKISNTFGRQALHAKSLGFLHPATGKKLCFDSDLPSDLKELIREFSSDKI